MRIRRQNSTNRTAGLFLKYLPADYTDCFETEIADKPHISPEELFDSVFVRHARWVSHLFRLRNALVKPLGLQTDTSFADLILERDEEEIILGKRDRHLTFHISLFCSQKHDGRQTIAVATFVKYRNLSGRIYFTVIGPFHRRIVRSSLRRAIRSWNEKSSVRQTSAES